MKWGAKVRGGAGRKGDTIISDGTTSVLTGTEGDDVIVGGRAARQTDGQGLLDAARPGVHPGGHSASLGRVRVSTRWVAVSSAVRQRWLNCRQNSAPRPDEAPVTRPMVFFSTVLSC